MTVLFLWGEYMTYLEEVVYLIKYYSLDYSSRFYFNKDKLNLFLYLYERHNVLRDEETFNFEYKLTIDMEGFLLLDSNIVQYIDCDVILDHLQRFHSKEDLEDIIQHTSKENIEVIKRIVDKYIGMDYDSILGLMSRIGGNVISPELALFTPLPYSLTDRQEIKDKIKELTII